MTTVTIKNITELPSAAKQLVDSLNGEKVIAFYGEMGSGKTTFIKAICEVLDVKDAISSPTFSIVNEYHSSSDKKIYHFDFYRINSQSEAFDMGYEEYFYSNHYCFIEWPDKIEELLPPSHKKVTIALQDEQRVISF